MQDDDLTLIVGKQVESTPQVQFRRIASMGRLEPGNSFMEHYVALACFDVGENGVAHTGEQICLHIRDLAQVRLLDHFEEYGVDGVLSAGAITADREGEEQEHKG